MFAITCSGVLCTPSLWVKSFLSPLPSIQGASSAPSSSGSRLVSNLWVVAVTWYNPHHIASCLALWDCSIVRSCTRAKSPIWWSSTRRLGAWSNSRSLASLNWYRFGLTILIFSSHYSSSLALTTSSDTVLSIVWIQLVVYHVMFSSSISSTASLTNIQRNG